MTTTTDLTATRADWLRRFNRVIANRLAGRFAGRVIYAAVLHTGRCSGRAYLTPVVAVPAPGGFIIPLPYGPGTDWRLNVQAAGGCRLRWRGREFELTTPRLVGPEEAVPHFPRWLYPLLRFTRIYLRMDLAPGPDGPADPQAPPEGEPGLLLSREERLAGALLLAALVGLAGWLITGRSRARR